MPTYQLVNQNLIPLEESTINLDEQTRQLPRGLYSTFITNHGGTRVLGLTMHLDRLYLPAELNGLRPSASRADLKRALASLASSAPHAESRFRVIMSETDGAIYVLIQSFTPPAKEIYERGVKVITAEMTRHDPRLKDTGFIAQSRAEREKVGGDVFEVLLAKKGKLYEGMTSNFYAVTHQGARGTLVTARNGILLGVTRRAVIQLARGQGMGVEYRYPNLDEVFAESFLTSSSRGVVPIVEIDGRPVGEGMVGPWTKRLALAYQAYVEERSEPIWEGQDER